MIKYESEIQVYDIVRDLLLNEKPYKIKKKVYSDIILGFDIETSSGWIKDGKVISDRLDIPEHDYLSFEPISLSYEWTLAIAGSTNQKQITYIYGRELTEAVEAFKAISSCADELGVDVCYCYIHNLAFEFAFLAGYMKVDSVFARNAHHPIKVVFKECKHIEFRCSYMLTRLSLASWGNQLGLDKSKDLDYLTIRTPRTYLYDYELNYCQIDVEIIIKGIVQELKQYKHIKSIPLTQTGKVRKEVKKALRNNSGYSRWIAKLLPKDHDEYIFLKSAYWGAYTHANMLYVGRILEKIFCYDFISSYPFCLLVEKYPNTPFIKWYTYDGNNVEYAYIIHVHMENVQAVKWNHFLSINKCMNLVNPKKDNGRLISTDSLDIICTGEDFEIIKQCYKFKYNFIEIRRSIKGWLPIQLVNEILLYYGNKTRYKNVEGKEDIYLQAKQYVNSIYGMMVTDILQDETTFENGNWILHLKSIDDFNDYLKEEKQNPKKRTFLNYAWGIWCTAYARKNLWECILHSDNDMYVAYSDTDSIKSTKELDFSWYNKRVLDKIAKVCESRGLNPALFSPVSPNGKVCTIGLFESEPYYKEFVTYGAKKYAYRSSEDGNIHITISGVPKGAAVALKDDIKNFTSNFKFERDLKNEKEKAVGNYLSYWTDESIKESGIVWNERKVDQYTSYEFTGVNIRRKSYQMGLTGDFESLIEIILNRHGMRITDV